MRRSVRAVAGRPTTVTLTIDGIEVTAPKGALLIRVAEQLGIEIPRFCDHPLLAPGRRLPPVPGRGGGAAQAGRLLHPDGRRGHGRRTQLTSPVAKKAQEGIMELLLINHPLDCPMCDKGGECPLQNQAMSHRPHRLAGSTSTSGSTRSRSPSPARCCSTASAACSASAAPGSPRRSPATSSST